MASDEDRPIWYPPLTGVEPKIADPIRILWDAMVRMRKSVEAPAAAATAPVQSPAEGYVLPKASAFSLGGIKVGSGLSIDGLGVLTAPASGVSVHSALSGLTADDHPQYHTDARGDLRYSALAHLHTGVYEPVITGGTTAQYWRGDKTWQTLPTSLPPSSHQLDGTAHTVSGLTPGSFLKATGADTFGFASHGLTYTDVGAASSGHTHAQLHDAATVADTASLDLTITGQQISGSVLPAGVDHNSLANLTTGNPHTQYAASGHTHAQLHDAATVADTTSLDLTLSGQQISGVVLPAGVDHNSLANLTTGNPHTQYLNVTHQASTAPHYNYRRRTGFASRTDNTISLSTRTVTNAPTGTSFKVYSLGTEYTKTSQSVTFANTAGLWFVYYGLDGVIAASQTPWVINGGGIPICCVFWTGTAGALIDERHGYERDLEWHYWAHHSIGSRYHSGLAGTFSASSTFSITSGQVMDEDLEHTVTAQTTCRLWYRSGGVFTFDAGATTPYKAVAGALQYDNGGNLAAVGANRYIVQWVYATGDAAYPIWIITAQAEHSTIAAARAETPPETQNLPVEEAKLLYGVIYRQASPATWQETQDYRNTSSGPAGTFVPTDHGTLSGLQDDDHPQYHTDARGDARYSLLAHTHSGVYEPVIAAGTTAQYWRGDKSWQTLPTPTPMTRWRARRGL